MTTATPSIPPGTARQAEAHERRGLGVSAQGKLLVPSLRCGRLGNRLILFANVIAFAAEYGHRVVNVTFHTYAHLFETTRRDIYCRYPIARRQSVWDRVPGAARAIRRSRMFYHVVRAIGVLNERHPIFGNKVVTLREQAGFSTELLEGPNIQARIREAKLVFVYGWHFRAPECVARHADEIRSYFRPVEAYERASEQELAPLRQKADIVVGVHLRLGDYRQWKGGKYCFPTSRYAAWMQEAVEQFPGRKVSFLVCSNEVRTAQEFPGLTVGFGPGSPLGDLSALAKCDYIFGPLSTFSQWASFYGNKPMFHLEDRDVRIEHGNFRVANLQKLF